MSEPPEVRGCVLHVLIAHDADGPIPSVRSPFAANARGLEREFLAREVGDG